MIEKQNLLVYEDGNCKIMYNFWSKFGDAGFWFYNKTDKNIYLNMEESFFILNDVAYDYYLNRVYSFQKSSFSSTNKQTTYGETATLGVSDSKSVTGYNYLDLLQTNQIGANASVSGMKTTSFSTSSASSSGMSISFAEEKVVCIPPNSAKKISEYCVNKGLFRSCDLLLLPKNKDKKDVTFNSEMESPFRFSNRIAYLIEGNQQTNYINNSFYVEKIENFSEKEVLDNTYKKDNGCGEEIILSTREYYWKIKTAPNMFYVIYNKFDYQTKH